MMLDKGQITDWDGEPEDARNRKPRRSAAAPEAPHRRLRARSSTAAKPFRPANTSR